MAESASAQGASYCQNVLNAVFGGIGLLVQFALFASCYVFLARTRGSAFALTAGGVFAIYGYGLFTSLGLLLAVPWQASNLLLAIMLAIWIGRLARTGVLSSGVAYGRSVIRRHWAAASIIALFALFQLFVAALKPELSIDGQLYHGPILANLIQTGSLWGWQAPNQYMYYTDLTMVSGINLSTFTGAVQFDDTIQTMHLVLLMFGIVWALGRRFRSSFVRAAFAALIVSAPVIWMQPRILYVDLAYGTAVALAIFFITFIREWGKAELWAAALTAAAIVATKPTGLLTGLLLGVVLAGVIIVRRSRAGAKPFTATLHTLLAFACALAASMSFYLRNFIAFANPVYPVQFSIGRFHFPGIIDLSVFASGDRGSGLVDPSRFGSYLNSIVSGAVHGVTKLDYDPRAGGFGQTPLYVLLLVLALLAAQLLWRARTRNWSAYWRGNWGTQTLLVALALAVIVIQPSAFDTRYVIGPTVVLCVAVLMTTLVTRSLYLIELLAGLAALALGLSTIIWTETNVYPGLRDVLTLRTTSAEWQPKTPGNPWGLSADMAWLQGSTGSCVRIALQTSGGVSSAGMKETAALSTLPYGLYGESLCNTVSPVQIDQYSSSAGTLTISARSNPLVSADYLVLYSDELSRWTNLIPSATSCWVTLQEIKGTEAYPQAQTVLKNVCAPNR